MSNFNKEQMYLDNVEDSVRMLRRNLDAMEELISDGDYQEASIALANALHSLKTAGANLLELAPPKEDPLAQILEMAKRGGHDISVEEVPMAIASNGNGGYV